LLEFKQTVRIQAARGQAAPLARVTTGPGEISGASVTTARARLAPLSFAKSLASNSTWPLRSNLPRKGGMQLSSLIGHLVAGLCAATAALVAPLLEELDHLGRDRLPDRLDDGEKVVAPDLMQREWVVASERRPAGRARRLMGLTKGALRSAFIARRAASWQIWTISAPEQPSVCPSPGVPSASSLAMRAAAGARRTRAARSSALVVSSTAILRRLMLKISLRDSSDGGPT